MKLRNSWTHTHCRKKRTAISPYFRLDLFRTFNISQCFFNHPQQWPKNETAKLYIHFAKMWINATYTCENKNAILFNLMIFLFEKYVTEMKNWFIWKCQNSHDINLHPSPGKINLLFKKVNNRKNERKYNLTARSRFASLPLFLSLTHWIKVLHKYVCLTVR